MIRRRVIGRFRRSKQGGWESEIQTLTIQRKIRLVPNDNRVTDSDPAFRVMLGWQTIGDAWQRISRRNPPRDYWRVRIDDLPNSSRLCEQQDRFVGRRIAADHLCEFVRLRWRNQTLNMFRIIVKTDHWRPAMSEKIHEPCVGQNHLLAHRTSIK